MYIMLKLLELVHLFTCMTLNTNANMKKYYRNEHYTILVLIKNLKLAIVLQMLSWGFRAFGIFFLICVLSMHSKRVLYFDSCRFLLLGGSSNVIGVLKFEVYYKGNLQANRPSFCK